MTKRGGKRGDRRRALPIILPLVLLAAQSIASASTYVYGVRVPGGYRVVSKHHPGTGVWHVALSRPGHQYVNVARLERGSGHSLRMLLSNGKVSGPTPRTERTSTMCSRVKCLVAVNGSFFTQGGEPIGLLVGDGRPFRSPADERYNFSLSPNGTLDISRPHMNSTMTTYYPRLPAGLLRSTQPPEERVITVDGLNVARESGTSVLYTPEFGPATQTRGGTELTARIVSPAGPLKAGVPTVVEFVSARSGGNGSRIPSNSIVLSGSGAAGSALSAFWTDVQTGRAESRATVMVSVSPAAYQSVAGKPVLLRDGRVATRSSSRPDARTIVGWNQRGDLLLVAIDGRQDGRSGLSVIDAAKLMSYLGAIDALNLDGGGSTTFVLGGRVVNRPSTSSHRERGVAVAVAIV